MIRIADFYFQDVNWIYAWWAIFWLLNGLDKYMSIFGKDRHQQFTDYFSLFNISEKLVDPVLWSFGVLEVGIGILFLFALAFSLISLERVNHVIHRVAFRLSFLTFFLFSIGDILFGDRAELLEHSTYLILVLTTYYIYVVRNQFRIQSVIQRNRIERQMERMNSISFRKEF